MKILFIIPSYKPAFIYGGTTVVISKLAEQLVLEGHEVSVYTTTANGKGEVAVQANEPVWVDGVKVVYFSRMTGDHTHLSPRLFKCLWDTVRQFDIVHIHTWWSLLIIGAAYICKLRKVKPIISPHGMLSSYTFEAHHMQSKKYLHKVLGKKLLENSYLHACTRLEWNDSLFINPEWKGFTLPNLIEMPDLLTERIKNEEFSICFLSRIDPKKNIELLLEALSHVSFDFKLKIAGAGEEEYIKSLKILIKSVGIEEYVDWAGWKKGREKFNFLKEADLFVLSSYNENFAIVVAEALAVGTPVLLSDTVGLAEYVEKKELGWICKAGNITDLTEKLEQAYSDQPKRKRIGTKAPALVKNDFDCAYLTKQYLDQYRHLSLKQDKK